TRRRQSLLIGGLRGLSERTLRIREHVNPRAVLRADVVALPHPLGWIVALPEHFQEIAIGNNGRIEHDEHDLVMPRAACTDLVVGRVRREAARIADGCRPDPDLELPELPLRAPKTAEPEHRRL